MTRRTLIIPLAVVLAVVAGYLLIAPIRGLLVPQSVVDLHRLRLGITADEVRKTWARRRFGGWEAGPTASRANWRTEA